MSFPAAFAHCGGDPDQGYSQHVVVERGAHVVSTVPLRL
jgi:hypothetical protein